MMRVHREGIACPDCLILIEHGEWPDGADRPAPVIGNHVHAVCSDDDGLRCFEDIATCDYCDLGRTFATYHPTAELVEVSKWTRDVIDDVLGQALTTLLWQGHELTDDDEMTTYSGDHNDVTVIPDDVVREVRKALVDWLEDHARAILSEPNARMGPDGHDVITVWDEDPGQIGHDWVLSSFGHGTGFWDRHSSSTAEGRIGDALDESAKDTVPDVTFELGDGRWFVS